MDEEKTVRCDLCLSVRCRCLNFIRGLLPEWEMEKLQKKWKSMSKEGKIKEIERLKGEEKEIWELTKILIFEDCSD